MSLQDIFLVSSFIRDILNVIINFKRINHMEGIMSLLKKYNFNKKFYKTLQFWIGILFVPGCINDLFLHHDFSLASWGTLLVTFMLLFDAFLQKEKQHG